MAKPADTRGAEPIPRRLARFAWIAALMNEQTWGSFERWTAEQLGVAMRRSQVDRHVRPIRPRGRQGRAITTGRPSPRDTPAFWRSLAVDEPALGLERHVLRIVPGSFRELQHLEWTLPAITGVRQVLRLAASGEYLVVVLVRSREELNELKARVQEHASGVVGTTEVEFESRAGASQTWLEIARRERNDPRPSRSPRS